MNEEKLKQLKKRIASARAGVSILEKQRRDVVLEIYFEKYGVRPGAVVRARGKLFRVSSIDCDCYFAEGRPFIYGTKQKKDGSWGARPQFIADWKLADQHGGE